MQQNRSQKTEDQILALADVMETGTMQHARSMLNELSPDEIAQVGLVFNGNGFDGFAGGNFSQ